MDRYLALDTETYLPGDVLTKVDRMSMAHGLEVRSPFLDYRIHEFAAALPASLKIRRGTTKYLLRQLALRRGLPADLVSRRKQGFGVPVGTWLRGDLRAWMTDVLSTPRATFTITSWQGLSRAYRSTRLRCGRPHRSALEPAGT